MNVIGHHAPCDERVPLAVEGEQRCLNQRGDAGPRQIAPAVSSIERCVDRKNAIPTSSFGNVFCYLRREAVGQAKYDMLNKVRGIEMRKISARSPDCLTVVCRQVE
jgi:hypothetical protein